MPVKTSTKAMCRRARELRAANGGNIAVIFALALVPLIGFIGAAVDYGHANSVKVALQRALDATALMLAKNAGTRTDDEMQATASSFFGAMLNRNEAIDPKVTVNYTPSNATVVLTATTSIKTDFMGLMGFKTLDIRTTATAAWGKNSLLRVALVLDNTGSMSSAGKMVAMQTAAKNMLSKLSSAAKTNGDVYVSIIPFVKDVNLGPGNYSQSWLLWDDGTDISWDGGKGSCSKSGFTPRSQCKGQGNCSISAQTSQPSCTAAGTCSISGNTTQNSCTAARQCTVGGGGIPRQLAKIMVELGPPVNGRLVCGRPRRGPPPATIRGMAVSLIAAMPRVRVLETTTLTPSHQRPAFRQRSTCPRIILRVPRRSWV